ncbi:cupin domain-containing protein [Sporosarcina cascadiensis]|uniref:cupin domain-containing protein n=1 Tax=Sporosarcina cascadiensis TaxID=2660747 RepID=UPI00129B6C83|nr:cupin domain-containing protein [Sporosarcina cascadiensis]
MKGMIPSNYQIPYLMFNCCMPVYIPLCNNMHSYRYPTQPSYTTNAPSPSATITDYGPSPFVVNIEEAAKQNNTFRTALWTGEYLQLTLMSLEVGEAIGLEMHPDVDQFIRIEAGEGLVQMGDRKEQLDFKRKVYDDFIFIIPAGKWHNLTNTGTQPLKLYSIYAPPEHPYGTVHATKEIAQAAEYHNG